MNINLPLSEMSIDEKIEAMELIWQDLGKSAEQIKSPIWHKQALDYRDIQINSGDSQFNSYQETKERILKNIK